MGNLLGNSNHVATNSTPDFCLPSTADSDEGDDKNVCGIFRGFCPPPKSKRPGYVRWNGEDPIGTPTQETPPNIRRMRMEANHVMSSKYAGLEKETTSIRMQKTPEGSDGTSSSSGKFGVDSMQSPSAEVHEGHDAENELLEKYEVCEVIGVGSTSTCHRCIERSTGDAYACKIIDKQQIEQLFKGMIDQFHTEIDALRKLRHPNIIHLNDVYITNTKIYLVMELMSGGELFDYVVQKGTLTEEEASLIIRKVTSAIVFMHQQNIIHRDLKPENLLLTHVPLSPNDLPEVKVIDFGLSKCSEEPVARSFLGTRGYLAPEMLQRRQYTRAVDAWALGVITYVLLCGCLPFDDDSATISEDILHSKFRLRFPRWAKNLSPAAKDLLSHLLDINPVKRYTAEQALDHPWVTGVAAPRNSYLQSPSMILKKSPALAGSVERRAAVKEHVHQIAKLRPPIDSPASIPLIRQTSI